LRPDAVDFDRFEIDRADAVAGGDRSVTLTAAAVN